MKWQEVREMYPNQFIKFEIVEYHEDDKTKYVDEVAVIKAIYNMFPNTPHVETVILLYKK